METVKSTINVPTRTVENTINGTVSQGDTDPPSRDDSMHLLQNDSTSKKKQNQKDIDENMTHITKLNPSEQDEIVGEPIDYSFCDIQNVTDLIKLKPNSGRRKTIPKQSKKADTNKPDHVSTATIQVC